MSSRIKEVLGRRILILGTMGSGKTRLTAEILDRLLENTVPTDITVIDMSPTTVPGVGGRVSTYTSNVFKARYLKPETVRAPRIEGKNRDEVLSFADFNRVKIEPLLQEFLARPTPVLIINDLSIYLHSGDVSKIVECLELANTVVANSYYSESLMDDKGSGVSEREKKLLDMLMNRFDHVLRTG
ncbi:MAG: ATP-binding protein [Crenarchaeota archaeon]|nr:ATP-binding protein [Thermoproteota archaeon]